MTAILGISAFYHDSATALVVDGDVVAAAQEERFSRKKHDDGFPTGAVAYCLDAAKLRPDELDYIAFYDKPLVKFERLLETYLAFAPAGLRSFRLAMPLWLRDKLHLRRVLRRGIPGAGRARLVFTDHHESHAASAFFPSPFDSAAILTLDGVGEWSTATMGEGHGNKLKLTHELRFPHSLGLLYSAFTYYCGFKVNSGEYKLMGLAPYGRPIYREAIESRLIDLKPDGSLWMNMDYFQFCQGLTMTNRRFDEQFGGPVRKPESRLEQRHCDLAASIQAVTEEVMLRMGRHLHQQTGQENLVLAGGVALNCVANGRLLREGPFRRIWIQPAAGDAGGALGAAWFVWHQLLGRPRISGGGLRSIPGGGLRSIPGGGLRSIPGGGLRSIPGGGLRGTAQPAVEGTALPESNGNATPSDRQHGSLLGPSFTNDEIAAFLAAQGAQAERFADEAALMEQVAALLAQGKIVGWFQGRMEFGPRGLGARSILGDPRSSDMQATMNLKVKFRESFRPFAPCVLAEYAAEWFELEPGQESPYMLLVAPVRECQRTPIDEATQRLMRDDPDLCRRVNVVRSTVPAITHVDYSARVQTVDAERSPRLHRLLRAFHAATGCPLLVNTSFNVRGEPIVCTPADAYRCFLATDIDALVIEDFMLVKDGATAAADEAQREKYLAQFQLD